MVSSVYIAKNVYGGDGLGRLGDGRVAFVPGAFAGEQVKAEIVEERRGYVKTRLVEVVEASPARTGFAPAPVPGMVYSNLSFDGELEAKAAQLEEMLYRAHLVHPEAKMIKAPLKELNYRNKAVYHFALSGSKMLFGYMAESSHDIVDIAKDPLAADAMNFALPSIRADVEKLLTRGAPAVRADVAKKEKVTVRWSERSGVRWWLGHDAPAGVILENTRGRIFEVPADGFYQVNPAAADALVAAVAERAAAAKPSEIIDLYCGVGVFGIVSAGLAAAPLRGVESNPAAVRSAVRNAAKNGVEASFATDRTAHALKKMRFAPGAAVIADPPRGGMEKGVAAAIARSGAAKVFYVSCDGATFVRDLKELSSAYEIEEILWIDMFPRTAKFESLAVLSKKEGR
ncbi:MAG: class I SAM-dependent RNA methyltransferase [Kiritimatiellae bacterium]|nr:class I SAM-dependent RNA methyltransferase [Kiritimatiellia bacterium]